MSSVDLDQVALGDAHVEQVLQVGRVAARLVGEAGRLRRLEPGRLVGRDDLVLELAQVGAQLRLEVGPGDPAQVADQLLRRRSAARRRRGPGRRRRRSRAATAPSAGRASSSAGTARAAGRATASMRSSSSRDHVGVQQQPAASGRRRPRPACPSACELGRSAPSACVRARGRRRAPGRPAVKPPKPPNQATVSARSLGVAGPQLLDALEHLQVPAADLARRPAAAPGRRRASCVADDSRTTNGWPHVAVAGSSRNSWARPHCPARRVSQSSSDTVPMISAVPMWKRTGARCLIGRRRRRPGSAAGPSATRDGTR